MASRGRQKIASGAPRMLRRELSVPSRSPVIRIRVDPRDVPAEKAARRLGLPLSAFEEIADRLYARGFPHPDPDTGLFDLKAVDDWMDRRSGLTSNLGPRDAAGVARARLEALTGGQGKAT